MRRVALVLASIILLPASHAFACSCVQQTAEEAYARATAVFEAHVDGIEHVGASGPGAGRLRVTFGVVQTWKGAQHEHFVLETSEVEASCGVPFVAGQSYLVYARGDEAQATTDLCSGTKLVTDAADEIAALGAGVVPVDITDTPPPTAVHPRAHGGRAGCATCSVASGLPSLPLSALLVGLVVAVGLRRTISRRTL